MNARSRAALVDVRTLAINPGHLTIEPLRYAKHFPLWPTLLAAGLAAALACAAMRPAFWALVGLFLTANILFWMRTRMRFRFGNVAPAIVVADSPLTLAVYTDLSTNQNEYPAIKILQHPRPQGVPISLGGKFAAITLHAGSAPEDRWQDFDPVLIESVASDRLLIERTFYSISDEEWLLFKSGLKDLPQPLKPGLYPIKRNPTRVGLS